MPPIAGYRAFKDGVARPVIDGPALRAKFDVKAAGAAHVKRDHVIVDVPAQGAGQLGACSNAAIVTAADLINVHRLQHQMDALRWQRHP